MVRSPREWYRTARSLRRQLGRRRNRAGGVRTISELRTRVITGIDGRQDTVAPAAGSIATEPRPADGGRLLGNRSRSAARSRTSPLPLLGVWFFRGLLVIPFVLMAPEIIALILGRPDSVANVSASTADVLGTSSFLLFVMMLTVTPVHTLTGWRWHLILRRDYGVAMFFTAGTDLTLAALTTGDTFPGGPLGRIAGHTFLVFGTILIHLAFLFGLSSIFLDALAVSAPLALMRLPAVRRWWHAARRARTHRLLRVGAAVLLIGLFSVGYTQLVAELATKGGAAFVQRPPSD